MAPYKQCKCEKALRAKCPHPWWGQFHGIRVSLSKWGRRLVTSKAEALEVFVDLQREVLAGRFRKGQPRRPKTFGEFAEDYIERHIVRRGRHPSEIYRVRGLARVFGERPLGEIGTMEFEEFLDALLDQGLCPATAHRYRARMRHMMRWAVARELLEKSPINFGALELPQEPPGRRRRVSPQELERLLAKAPEWMQGMIITAIDTGLRLGALLGLTFGMVDPAKGRIVVPRALMKNQHCLFDHEVSLTERVKAIITGRRAAEIDGCGDDNLVFGVDGWTFRRTWVRLLRQARIPRSPDGVGWDLRFHDLRREFGSRLAENGVDIVWISKLLDHASVDMTRRYLAIRPEALQEAIRKLDAYNAMLAAKAAETNKNAEAELAVTSETVH